MNALTGWIPDKIDIKDKQFNADKIFRSLKERHNQGNVLMTVATGNLSEDIAKKAGLVPSHAYALLDMREVEVSAKLKRFLVNLISSFFGFFHFKGQKVVALKKSVEAFEMEGQLFRM